MTEDVEKTLDRLPKAAPSPELKARIAGAIGEVKPVRARMPAPARTLVLSAVGMGIAFGIAAAFGFRPMDATQWAVLALLAASATAGAWLAMRLAVPGEAPPRIVRAVFLVVPVALAALAVLLLGTGGGIGPSFCMKLGLLVAIVPWLLTVILLARGYPTAPVVAGGIGGMVAGLWAVSMLHLTCAMQTAPHLMLWHGGVLVVAALAGALTGHFALRRRG